MKQPATGRMWAGRLALVLLAVMSVYVAWGPLQAAIHRWQMEALLNEKLKGHFQIVRMRSKDLRRTNNVYIYTPPGYKTSTLRYPVVYLLHGCPGQGRDWFVKGRAHETAERLILAKQIQPMILVCADDFGRGGPEDHAEYLNSARGGVQAEDYIAHELPQYVDSHFRTIPNARALIGLSSGGYGAINVGTKHQDIFHVLASHSGYFDPDLEAGPIEDILGKKGNRLWEENDPHKHVSEWRSDKSLRIYLDCGDADDLLPDNQQLDKELSASGVRHVFYVTSGAHHWSVWRGRLQYSLKYVDTCFKRLADK